MEWFRRFRRWWNTPIFGQGYKLVPGKDGIIPEDELVLFDCPLCILPAEPVRTVVTWHPQEGMVTHIVVQCLGPHPAYTVTDAWYQTHVAHRS